MRHEINKIQSKVHNVRTYSINKISLSCYDNKKHIIEDGCSRLSHFYKSTLHKSFSETILIFNLNKTL